MNMKLINGKLPVIAILLLLAILCVMMVSGKLAGGDAKQIVAVATLVLLLVTGIYLLWDNNALRDTSTQCDGEKPYSFARVQLWWWTLVILGCYLGMYAHTGKYWELNATCLILLGISTATTVSGSLVDTRQIEDPKVIRGQDTPSQGFLKDILSDEQGVSMHRFQALVFNVAFGASFVISVFSEPGKGEFPVFDEFTLGLMGISSATYVAMKTNENKPGTIPETATGSSGNDELADLSTSTGTDQ